MTKVIEYPIYGKEDDFASLKTGEIVKASRTIGYKRCMTKTAKKDLYDRYGALYMSTMHVLQKFDPACCVNVFMVLCELTKEGTNEIDYSVSNIIRQTGFSKSTIMNCMARLRKCNIVLTIENEIGNKQMFMNPLVMSKMSKTDRFNFYANNDCCVIFSPEDLRKDLR